VREDAQVESCSNKLRLHSPLLDSSLLMNCQVLEWDTNSKLLLIQVKPCLLLAAS